MLFRHKYDSFTHSFFYFFLSHFYTLYFITFVHVFKYCLLVESNEPTATRTDSIPCERKSNNNKIEDKTNEKKKTNSSEQMKRWKIAVAIKRKIHCTYLNWASYFFLKFSGKEAWSQIISLLLKWFLYSYCIFDGWIRWCQWNNYWICFGKSTDYTVFVFLFLFFFIVFLCCEQSHHQHALFVEENLFYG